MSLFKEVDFGGKLVIIATAIAFISLFFNWIDAGFIAVNGFQQQGYLFLLLFIYPLIQVLRKEQINKIAGLSCSVIAIIGIIVYIMSKNINFLGKVINMASTGTYVFALAGIILLVGVLKQKKQKTDVVHGLSN